MAASGGVSIARTRGENRFYHPPAMRNRLQQQQQEQQQQQRQERTQCQMSMNSTNKSSSSSVSCSVKLDECSASTTTSKEWVESQNLTNLDRFLEYTTPRVLAQHLPKRSMRDWKTRAAELHQYFVLGELWESFREWSAYGAGVPLLLNGTDSVVQYYVPYLSGIQLYVDLLKPSPTRRPGDGSDMDSSRETSSEGSNDYGAGRATSCSNRVWSQQDFSDGKTQRLNRLSPRNNHSVSSSSDESQTGSPQGHLVFEYFEHDPPYSREPLADKILLLTSQFPELRTYRSCDLSPKSWISVAWYPIYRIPTGPTLQNLDACFLTFHSLSTAFNGSSSTDMPHIRPTSIGDGKLSLPTFGLAYYKFKASFWNSNAVHECQSASFLLEAAEAWVRFLQVNHPDYKFFASHISYRK